MVLFVKKGNCYNFWVLTTPCFSPIISQFINELIIFLFSPQLKKKQSLVDILDFVIEEKRGTIESK